MTTEQLKNLLNAVADEVTPVSVYDRAVARSKRKTTHQVVLASVATLAMLGAGALGYSAIADGTADRRTAAAGELSGTFYEATSEKGQGDTLWSWQPGDEKPTEVIAPGTDDGKYYDTGAISPDGRYLSYLTELAKDADKASNGSKVKVRDLKTGEITEVAEYSDANGETCSAPAWTPDGERLFVDRGEDFDDERIGYVDIATSKFTPMENQNVGCSAAVTVYSKGDLLASLVEENGKTIMEQNFNEDGVLGSVPIEDYLAGSDKPYVRELTAISPDGRYACFSTDSEEAVILALTRSGECDVMLDLEADEVVDAPVDGGDWYAPISAFAVPDRLLVYTGESTQVKLYDFDGGLAAKVTTPWQDGEDTIALGFVPE